MRVRGLNNIKLTLLKSLLSLLLRERGIIVTVFSFQFVLIKKQSFISFKVKFSGKPTKIIFRVAITDQRCRREVVWCVIDVPTIK